VHYVPGADAEDNAGDRNDLVLAKPSVIMNDRRLGRIFRYGEGIPATSFQ
jgi:hypothetical protein